MLNEESAEPLPAENTTDYRSPRDKLLNFLSCDEDEGDGVLSEAEAMDKLLNSVSYDDGEQEILSEAAAEEELRQKGIETLAVRQKIKDILFAPAPVPVLVVQPFSTLNTEADGEVLLDMADQISLRLSRYKQVIVRPSSSVAGLSPAIQDPVNLGRKLGADFVLTGNILGEGEKFSLVARFSRVRDGAELWEGKYDGSVNQIFETEDLLAERVIRRLNLRLAKNELGRLTRNHSENPRAYHKYRLGRCYLNQHTKTSLAKAADLFEGAIGLDSGFAPAHAGLADCHLARGIYNMSSPAANFEKAFAHARDAVSRDATLVEAHTSCAYSYMFARWKWGVAEGAFKKAIEVNPNYAPAHQGYAHLLGALGRFQEAKVEIQRALDLDECSAFANTVSGFIYYYSGDYEESRRQFYRARNINSHFDGAYYGVALACEQLALDCLKRNEPTAARENFDEAEWAARRALKFSRNNSQKRALKAHIYALMKEQDKVLDELSQLEALSITEYISPFTMATIYAAQGRTDKAIAYLKRAYLVRDPWLVLLNVEPRFVSVRHDRGFKKLIRKLNFPPASPH